MTPTCPKCGKVIPSDDVNVAKDIAYCRSCNLSHQLSTLTLDAEINEGVNLNSPPAGAWYRNNGMGTVIGASHRSFGKALGALAVMLFWNGIVSVFVLLAIAGTLRNLHIPLPHWFPAPSMNDGPMSAGMTLFLWIFLTPFIVIGLGMIGAFLSFLAGQTEVRIGNTDGVVYCGIGSIGWRRRFDAAAVKQVRIDERNWSDSDGNRQRNVCIFIETRTGKQLKFGSLLTPERRRFVAAATRQALLK